MSQALDIYFEELKITKIFCSILGFDGFSQTFKYNFMTFYSPFYMVLYHFAQFYSIYYFRNDFLNLVFCLVCWAYAFQVLINLESFFFYSFLFVHLILIQFFRE